jgi:D-alanyl-lipoteichoic acid acyltransferase DltB (MBOAT superfamily)
VSDAAAALPSASARQAGRAASLVPPTVQVFLQLALAAAVVYLYRIEGDAFFRVFLLAAVGFAVNAVLPLAYRLPFFVGLSLAGTALVFGPVDAAWLVTSGLVLIGLANLPLPLKVRAGVLVAVAILLAVGRAGVAPVPWSSAVWPILASMFMFRLVLYLMSLRTEPRPQRHLWALAYFFMLPNLVFPLFPVVDYQTFRRTYYDRDAHEIHERGLLWIARGLVHLLLYRVIYHNVVGDAESVVTLGDLVQFMLGTFLLYLRVSGQFHLIVGILHLFGFRLPETHKLYYLAHSFTELWRRINIYWTDFMMKTVFYPTYFKVKGRGPTSALVLSTAAVFVTTWVLHSYQWFWLRGGFPLTAQDVLFWGILGGLVIAGGLRELKAGKKPKAAARFWNPARGLQAAATFSLFCLLWSLWSIESVGLWVWLLGSAANVDLKGVVLVSVAFLTIMFLGGIDWSASARTAPAWFQRASEPSMRALASLLLLIGLAQPAVRGAAPDALASAIAAMQTTGLNARDLAMQHRGYYEQLDVRAQLDTPVDANGRKKDATWQDLSQLDVLNDRRDLMLRDLRPLSRTTWNGNAFSTNRWGMRDQDYPEAKPEGTLRIALLGPSHVMGNGVADGETFEAVLEERLNREPPAGRYRRVEILNFGVDGYSLPQQLAILEDRVFRFQPDVVIATHYQDNAEMTEGFLMKVADQHIPVTDPVLRQEMADGGLLDIGDQGVPVPYAWARSLAGAAGIPARMPFGEARSRARRITPVVLASSFERFARIARARGVAPAILALNVVVDDVPAEIPLRSVIEGAGLPVFDLFDVFPESRRPALRVAPWDDHPNAEGHRLVAERLFPEIKTFLASGALERARAGRETE